VGDQDDREAVDLADCLPALLTVLDPILNREVQWIKKHASCDFKTEAMLALVGQVFALVPDKEWRCHVKNVTTNNVAIQVLGEASIDQAVAAIDDDYQQALHPESGEFLMQVVGVLDNPLGF